MRGANFKFTEINVKTLIFVEVSSAKFLTKCHKFELSYAVCTSQHNGLTNRKN